MMTRTPSCPHSLLSWYNHRRVNVALLENDKYKFCSGRGAWDAMRLEFTPSFLRTTHMWIRLKGLDATTNQEQQVAANLTEVLPDDDLEKAQAFLSNALARAASVASSRHIAGAGAGRGLLGVRAQ